MNKMKKKTKKTKEKTVKKNSQKNAKKIHTPTNLVGVHIEGREGLVDVETRITADDFLDTFLVCQHQALEELTEREHLEEVERIPPCGGQDGRRLNVAEQDGHVQRCHAKRFLHLESSLS